eukprot:TRINITY_DN37382_c0_g1_i1.p1 TRINITY_DN37382_c0_g1~~TRINITY_DN37382_c0_g1_i1.p1  ORF type:complete len:125 (+),score=0.43 TRINITY_DN37382_c0_g1_i1:332-706(+)
MFSSCIGLRENQEQKANQTFKSGSPPMGPVLSLVSVVFTVADLCCYKKTALRWKEENEEKKELHRKRHPNVSFDFVLHFFFLSSSYFRFFFFRLSFSWWVITTVKIKRIHCHEITNNRNHASFF